MAVELTSDALTLLATVKIELGIAADTYDDALKRMINAVSRRIRSYCDRIFYYEADIEESVPGYGDTLLRMSRFPILSIDSIAYDGTAIDSDTYSSADKNAAAGLIYSEYGWVWTAKSLNSVMGDWVPGTEEDLYTVTYTAGFVTPAQETGELVRTLPWDLEDACIQAVASRWAGMGRDLSIESEKSLNYSVKYWSTAGDLSQSVKSMLAPYVRAW